MAKSGARSWQCPTGFDAKETSKALKTNRAMKAHTTKLVQMGLAAQELSVPSTLGRFAQTNSLGFPMEGWESAHRERRRRIKSGIRSKDWQPFRYP